MVKLKGNNTCEYCGEEIRSDSEEVTVLDDKLYHDECLPGCLPIIQYTTNHPPI